MDTFVEIAPVWIAAVGIWAGIGAMVRSNNKRTEQQDKAMALQREFMAQQRKAEDRRHEESMAGLKELIRRTAPAGSGAGE